MDSLNLVTEVLLNIGMDGPNVNKKFLRDLRSELEKVHTDLIYIGSCPLHIISDGFGKGIKYIDAIVNFDQFAIDQFAIDLHSFFKLSAARREDLSEMSNFTDVIVHYVIRHCESRCLSIEKVLVRINEQWPNLQYFLTELPKRPEFKGKSGVNSADRYKRIKG